MAVLRYDDRGVGGSTGAGPNVTTEDFARDAMAALAWLSKRPEMRAHRVGMLGHSEGGLAAAIAASRSRDVAFIVMLAGTSVKGEYIIRAQAEAMARAAGATPEDLKKLSAQQELLFSAVRTGQGWDAVIESARALGREQIANLPEAQRQAIQDPEKALDMAIQAQLSAAKSGWSSSSSTTTRRRRSPKSRVRCSRCSDRHLQVPAEVNREALEAALGKAGNRDVTVQVYDGANHLFIKAVTGSPTDAARSRRPSCRGCWTRISGWILTRTK
jgi:dienelactone hydrolase